MARIGIENISVFGLPPVAFVTLAADLGCQHISTGLIGFDFGVCDYPSFSLRDDAALRGEMVAVMRDRGVSISLGEGCTVRPDIAVDDYARDLDLFVELGTERINTVSMDPDFARTCDQIARLTELASERGLRMTTELAPSLTLPDLPTALECLRQVGDLRLRLLIDTMHVLRSGSTPADIAALDPDLIDYIQVSDATRDGRLGSYFEEAMYGRMVPGEGELDVRELIAVLPDDRVYALEVPLRTQALAGVGPAARLGPAVTALRRMLDETHGAFA